MMKVPMMTMKKHTDLNVLTKWHKKRLNDFQWQCDLQFSFAFHFNFGFFLISGTTCDYDFQWQCDLFYTLRKIDRMCMLENYQLSFAFHS